MEFNVISPQTTAELFEAMKANLANNFRIGAGCTDLLIELKKQPDPGLTVINLARLEDDLFTSIRETDAVIRIGALITAEKLCHDLHVRDRFPVLRQAANQLASMQIRHVATVGGNICTASPAGDIACALVALEANCEIVSATGNERTVPLKDLFTGVRMTDLKRDEILRSVTIPCSSLGRKTYSGFIKIGTRRSMECSVVSLAYHILADADDVVQHAGIAVGSVAPTIKFCASACQYLAGKDVSAIDRAESEEFASKIVEYASPISDIRASAWYRTEVLYNISKSIFETNKTLQANLND